MSLSTTVSPCCVYCCFQMAAPFLLSLATKEYVEFNAPFDTSANQPSVEVEVPQMTNPPSAEAAAPLMMSAPLPSMSVTGSFSISLISTPPSVVVSFEVVGSVTGSVIGSVTGSVVG